MLAAQSAQAVLSAEHEQIREFLVQVDEVVQSGAGAFGEQARALLRLVERLQAFDEGIHRPKGVMLLLALRGRSTESDDLLLRLATMRERGDDLLSQVRTKLGAAVAGDTRTAADVEALLEEHRALTLAQLETEDSFLHSQSAAHLTRDEWAAIASSISEAMAQTKN
jgi:hypothetical protein